MATKDKIWISISVRALVTEELFRDHNDLRSLKLKAYRYNPDCGILVIRAHLGNIYNGIKEETILFVLKKDKSWFIDNKIIAPTDKAAAWFKANVIINAAGNQIEIHAEDVTDTYLYNNNNWELKMDTTAKQATIEEPISKSAASFSITSQIEIPTGVSDFIKADLNKINTSSNNRQIELRGYVSQNKRRAVVHAELVSEDDIFSYLNIYNIIHAHHWHWDGHIMLDDNKHVDHLNITASGDEIVVDYGIGRSYHRREDGKWIEKTLEQIQAIKEVEDDYIDVEDQIRSTRAQESFDRPPYAEEEAEVKVAPAIEIEPLAKTFILNDAMRRFRLKRALAEVASIALYKQGEAQYAAVLTTIKNNKQEVIKAVIYLCEIHANGKWGSRETIEIEDRYIPHLDYGKIEVEPEGQNISIKYKDKDQTFILSKQNGKQWRSNPITITTKPKEQKSMPKEEQFNLPIDDDRTFPELPLETENFIIKDMQSGGLMPFHGAQVNIVNINYNTDESVAAVTATIEDDPTSTNSAAKISVYMFIVEQSGTWISIGVIVLENRPYRSLFINDIGDQVDIHYHTVPKEVQQYKLNFDVKTWLRIQPEEKDNNMKKDELSDLSKLSPETKKIFNDIKDRVKTVAGEAAGNDTIVSTKNTSISKNGKRAVICVHLKQQDGTILKTFLMVYNIPADGGYKFDNVIELAPKACEDLYISNDARIITVNQTNDPEQIVLYQKSHDRKWHVKEPISTTTTSEPEDTNAEDLEDMGDFVVGLHDDLAVFDDWPIVTVAENIVLNSVKVRDRSLAKSILPITSIDGKRVITCSSVIEHGAFKKVAVVVFDVEEINENSLETDEKYLRRLNAVIVLQNRQVEDIWLSNSTNDVLAVKYAGQQEVVYYIMSSEHGWFAMTNSQVYNANTHLFSHKGIDIEKLTIAQMSIVESLAEAGVDQESTYCKDVVISTTGKHVGLVIDSYSEQTSEIDKTILYLFDISDSSSEWKQIQSAIELKPEHCSILEINDVNKTIKVRYMSDEKETTLDWQGKPTEFKQETFSPQKEVETGNNYHVVMLLDKRVLDHLGIEQSLITQPAVVQQMMVTGWTEGSQLTYRTIAVNNSQDMAAIYISNNSNDGAVAKAKILMLKCRTPNSAVNAPYQNWEIADVVVLKDEFRDNFSIGYTGENVVLSFTANDTLRVVNATADGDDERFVEIGGVWTNVSEFDETIAKGQRVIDINKIIDEELSEYKDSNGVICDIVVSNCERFEHNDRNYCVVVGWARSQTSRRTEVARIFVGELKDKEKITEWLNYDIIHIEEFHLSLLDFNLPMTISMFSEDQIAVYQTDTSSVPIVSYIRTEEGWNAYSPFINSKEEAGIAVGQDLSKSTNIFDETDFKSFIYTDLRAATGDMFNDIELSIPVNNHRGDRVAVIATMPAADCSVKPSAAIYIFQVVKGLFIFESKILPNSKLENVLWADSVVSGKNIIDFTFDGFLAVDGTSASKTIFIKDNDGDWNRSLDNQEVSERRPNVPPFALGLDEGVELPKMFEVTSSQSLKETIDYAKANSMELVYYKDDTYVFASIINAPTLVVKLVK